MNVMKSMMRNGLGYAALGFGTLIIVVHYFKPSAQLPSSWPEMWFKAIACLIFGCGVLSWSLAPQSLTIEQSKRQRRKRGRDHQFTFFISYASEDKQTIAKPLADYLIEQGCRVWLDEYEIRLGDDVSKKIKEGLASCRWGLVIFSRIFFDKYWTQLELQELLQKESDGNAVLVPIWHEIDRDFVAQQSEKLSDRFSFSSRSGISAIGNNLISIIERPSAMPSVLKRIGAFIFRFHLSLVVLLALALLNAGIRIAKFEDISEYHPEVARAYNLIAEGCPDDALKAFNQAVERDPSSSDLLLARSKFLREKINNREAALADASRAIQFDSWNGLAYFQRASIELSDGNFSAAIEDSTAALWMSPTFLLAPGIYTLRGDAFQGRGSYENIDDLISAESDYSMAIRLYPTAYLYERRGHLRLILQDNAGATVDLRKADVLRRKE